MKQWAIIIFGAIAAAFGILFYGKKKGQDEQKAKTTEQVIKDVETKVKSDIDSDNMSDAERREWLRNNSIRK